MQLDIFLEIHHFSLEDDENCEKDSLTIYDGSSFDDPVIGMYCGIKSIFSVQSTANNILLHFISDAADTAFGFGIYYNIDIGTYLKYSK